MSALLVFKKSSETYLLSVGVVDTARNKAGRDPALMEWIIAWRRQRGDK